MRFRYKGLFQSAELVISRQDMGSTYKMTCKADIKLPMFKKQFVTSTEYLSSNHQWVCHWPLQEHPDPAQFVRREQIVEKEVIDPIGLFMQIDKNATLAKEMSLLIGKKRIAVELTKPSQDTIEVLRQEKDQKLIFKKSNLGIQSIEIPVPVIGNIRIERCE